MIGVCAGYLFLGFHDRLAVVTIMMRMMLMIRRLIMILIYISSFYFRNTGSAMLGGP